VGCGSVVGNGAVLDGQNMNDLGTVPNVADDSVIANAIRFEGEAVSGVGVLAVKRGDAHGHGRESGGIDKAR